MRVRSALAVFAWIFAARLDRVAGFPSLLDTRTKRNKKLFRRTDRQARDSNESAEAQVWLLKLQGNQSAAPASLCQATQCECSPMDGLGLVVATCGAEEVAELLDARPELEFAEEDGSVTIDLPAVSQPPAARSTDAPPWNLARIGLLGAAATGKGVRVWVLDTGINPTHEDLRGRVTLVGFVRGLFSVKDCDSNSDERCLDDDGHGTHVAGIVAGTRFGVAREAQVLSMRVLNKDGSGKTSTIVGSLKKIVDRRKPGDIVNLSLGGGGYTPSVTAALKKLTEAGVHVIVAAGNDDVDSCQGSFSGNKPIFVVGSSNSRNDRSSFSNWGECLDLYAPGEWIEAADYKKDTDYTVKSGTSMAAPHVAGVAALFLQNSRSASPEALYHFLKASAKWGALTSLKPGDPNRLLYIGNVDPAKSENLTQSDKDAGGWTWDAAVSSRRPMPWAVALCAVGVGLARPS